MAGVASAIAGVYKLGALIYVSTYLNPAAAQKAIYHVPNILEGIALITLGVLCFALRDFFKKL